MYDMGNYWCKVTHQKLGETKEKRTPQWVLSFVTLGKVNPADPEGDLIACPDYERSVYRYFTDGAVEYLIKDFAHLCERKGVAAELSDFALLDEDAPGFIDLLGVEFTASCEHEDYNGKQKERWSIVRGNTGLDVAPLDDQGVRKLNAMFGKHLKTLSNGAKKPAQPAAPQSKADQAAKGRNPEIAAEVAKLTPADEIPF